MSSIRELGECCICMDAINNTTNNCVTPCGHTFCFKCLAKALEQNNTCPCCRAVLMEEPETDENEDDIWSEITDDDEGELYSDNALTGFRLFYQRINGENIENDENQHVSSNNDSIVSEITTDDDDEDEDEDEDEYEGLATVEDITAKLQSRGITMLDLVAMLSGRKSKKVEKHTNRFIDALDSILGKAMDDCDNEARELYERNNAIMQR